jgi:hypothetical protein
MQADGLARSNFRNASRDTYPMGIEDIDLWIATAPRRPVSIFINLN